jgi:outer membrane protein TolC
LPPTQSNTERRQALRKSNRILLLTVCILLPAATSATAGVGDESETDPILDRYVDIGLENNLALRQKDFSYEKSLKALFEAKGMFFPKVEIAARYTRAGGGREIEFPVGDLMNPVYATLNQLLSYSGLEPQNFPVLENETIPFLREEEHETKVRLLQPIFEPAIWYNYKIHSSLGKAAGAERDAYRRQLVADIKTAYFNWLKAAEVVDLLHETKDLLDENLRVSRSLQNNGMATVDVVYRAEAEIYANDQYIAEAEKATKLAASYFNFLLNRPLSHGIERPQKEYSVSGDQAELDPAIKSAKEGREELRQLEYAVEAAGNSVKLSSSAYLPSISLVLDYGFQGEDYRFSGEDDFWMGSLVLSWTLFDGLQRKAKRDQSIMEKRIYETKLSEFREQIELQVTEAWDNLRVARFAITTATARSRSSGRSFEIVRKKYNSGMASQVEFLDARTTMTNAEVDRILAVYDYQIRQAEFERVAALVPGLEGERDD